MRKTTTCSSTAAEEGATFLLNSPLTRRTKVWDSHAEGNADSTIIDKKLKVYAIDAYDVAP